MTKAIKTASALLALALTCNLAAWAQGAQTPGSAQNLPSASSEQGGNASYLKSPEHYFRLTFRVLDVSPEGKIVNSRSYTETIASGLKSERTSSIRTGDRIPVVASSNNTEITSSLVNTQYQYIDIGTSIDAQNVEITDQMLHLYVTASISAISSAPPAKLALPIVRQTKWNSYATIPIDKPTLIFSADNSADKGKTELELTAVPINQ
ncbi:MAG: hypothetical protein WA634_06920 [Silvibacterium sp.]